MARILYLSHDIVKPSGGVKVLYHHVHHLVEAGMDAAIMHLKAGLQLDWFPLKVPVIDGSGGPEISPDDWIVFPEDHMVGLEAFRDVKCHKAVFCQNHHYVFDNLPLGKSWRDYGIERVLVCSREIQDFVRYVFGSECAYIPNAINHHCFYPKEEQRRLQIALMPRKGFWNILMVRGMLWHRRPDLRPIPWAPIDAMSEQDVAMTLQQSAIFLSTSFREGFGLPPVEAMACGCVVVGFSGGGGNDYANPNNGFWVDDEDTLALGQKLEQILIEFKDNPQDEKWEAMRREGSKTSDRYHSNKQRQRLVRFWSETLNEKSRRRDG
jgi:glycosyltransferase involved in cell wall biosynthesis